MTNVVQYAEKHWIWLAFAIPVAAYAAWIATMVVPEVVRIVVPEVTKAVVGR